MSDFAAVLIYLVVAVATWPAFLQLGRALVLAAALAKQATRKVLLKDKSDKEVGK